MDGLGAGTPSANVAASSGVHNPTTADFSNGRSIADQVNVTVVCRRPTRRAATTGCLIQRSP
jgi:hypothetical protein